MSQKLLSITMTKSKIGRLPNHLACLKGLGLKKIRQTVKVIDSVENRGLINKVAFMVKVEEV